MHTLNKVFLTNLLLCISATIACEADTNTNWLTDVNTYQACALTEKKPFAQYTATKINYTLTPQAYVLPVNPAQIENLDRDIRNNPEFDFSDDAEAKLLEAGFVIVPANSAINRFDDAYETLKLSERPTLITVDSSLHLGHLFFTQVIKYVEVQRLIPTLNALLTGLANTLATIYKAQNGDLKEAALSDLAFVSVALKLLGSSDFEVQAIIAEQVEREVTNIESAGQALELGREPNAIFNRDCSREIACSETDIDDQEYEKGKACLCEDYRQYKPRGHYAQTNALSRYFRSATYLSRMRLRVKSPIETQMAALLTAALNKTVIDFNDETIQAAFLWDRIYRTVSFFVGATDDLTFIEYDKLLRDTYGDTFSISDLSDIDKLERFRTKLLQERERRLKTGYTRAVLDSAENTTGLSFLNRAFPFDAYALSQLVYGQVGPNPDHPSYDILLDNLNAECKAEAPEEEITDTFQQCDGQSSADYRYICCSSIELARSENRSELADVCRLLPSALDIAAVFGSVRAQEHVAEDAQGYCGYESTMESLQHEVLVFTEADWYKTLASTWSLALQPLFNKNLAGFPTWMTTGLYQDKNLNTALSSWAQLRHDTVQYIKPGFVTVTSPIDLYWLEPLPEVYAALSDLAKLVRTGLQDMALLNEELSEPINGIIDRFDSLTAIAIDELEARDLTALEIATLAFINDELISSIDTLTQVTGDYGKSYDTTFISDIYHDKYLDNTLYSGSGPIDWLIALRRVEDDQLRAIIGPVFSYYEFSRSNEEPLDDNQWTKYLVSDIKPARPDFVQDLFPSNE